MMLIYDKVYIEDFGECKGVGRCGTCHVHVWHAPTGMFFHDGVEHTTLARLADVQENSHLACQIMVNKSINGLVVQVVDAA
ncbi:2Fe-2S iron-sulfur cluster-binding protein [Pontibacter liquoris]|uniref:2Fe-2S iron-sulfur cluster-binding protein n=1 Tax=Pontibacter liquoris TaxID=2905677 RepID=UPI001FA6C2D4|nr:2Fe-2S iron-sulfur cluster-binding protein [Pontibacter liquoris]